ncbi:lactonase family protein [Formosa sediminum]|uniref:Lactonase family protein n=1 Tax=Formosa sediminum TaxID=2594004 RepID=A0A516GQB7_9FLAO|nr:lactonase family protein [Formosa sediminum]QDO93724.1 lactonase family protein [Formosa sediminum]
MKTFVSIIGLCLCLLCSCNSKKSNPESQTQGFPFYVGTYTNNESKGIYKYELQPDGTFLELGLQSITENPSFLSFSADKKHLLAANKKDPYQGNVTSFKITPDSLALNNMMFSGGFNPCFVTTNKDNQILVANYGNGTLTHLELKTDGFFNTTIDVKKHTGTGTTSRQEGPHTHAAYFVPNSEDIIAIDLGTNSLWFYTLNKDTNKLQPNPELNLTMADGAGPRHLTFHPNNKWIYVLNELNNTVTKIERQAGGRYKIKESISTLPENHTADSYAADIHISSDGKFLYASNRGFNSIAIYEVDPTDGTLKTIGFEPTKGETPRNFSLSPKEDFIVVAHRNSDNLVSFKRDQDTGLLTYVDEIKAPTPSFVLFE